MIWYKGVSLTDVSPAVVAQVSVSGLDALPLSRQRPVGYGAVYAGLRHGIRTVDVEFELPVGHRQYRQEALMQVCAWAAGTEPAPLCLPYRQGQHLLAVCTKFPQANAAAWDQALHLTFTAFDPLWRSDFEKSAAVAEDVFIGGMIEPEMRLVLDNETQQDIAWTQDGRTLRLVSMPAGRVEVDLNRQLITLDGQSACMRMSVLSTFPRPVTGRLNMTGPGRVFWRERWV